MFLEKQVAKKEARNEVLLPSLKRNYRASTKPIQFPMGSLRFGVADERNAVIRQTTPQNCQKFQSGWGAGKVLTGAIIGDRRISGNGIFQGMLRTDERQGAKEQKPRSQPAAAWPIARTPLPPKGAEGARTPSIVKVWSRTCTQHPVYSSSPKSSSR